MKKLLAMLLALVMVLSLAACGDKKDKDEEADEKTTAADTVKEDGKGDEKPETTEPEATEPEVTEPEEEEYNPEFLAVFEEMGIEYVPEKAPAGCESIAIIEKEDEGIAHMELFYKGDKAMKMVANAYMSLEGVPADQVDLLLEQLDGAYDGMLPEGSAVKIEKVGNYAVIKMTFDNLDDPEILEALVESGLFEEDDIKEDEDGKYISVEDALDGAEDSIVR